MRDDLPPLPPRIAKLRRDHRGFPVPWFVQYLKDGKPVAAGEGEPDFRVMDFVKFRRTLFGSQPLCWICGEQMGKHRVFTIGPMCSVNRVISEPPSHRECAEFAVEACPFLARPRMRRNEKDLPEGGNVAGFHIDRNPGVTCLWETPSYKPFRAGQGGQGWLIRLGEPTRTDWYSHGRLATRAEVIQAMDDGMPTLWELAGQDGPEGIAEVEKLRSIAWRYLPAA